MSDTVEFGAARLIGVCGLAEEFYAGTTNRSSRGIGDDGCDGDGFVARCKPAADVAAVQDERDRDYREESGDASDSSV